jgi:signal transduction histidine kinase
VDYFEKLVKQIAFYIFIATLLPSALVGALLWFGLTKFTDFPPIIMALGAVVVGLTSGFFISKLVARKAVEPVQFLWKAILHVSPGHQEVSAPDLNKSKIGRELVTSLALQVYQLASTEPAAAVPVKHEGPTMPTKVESTTIMQSFPLPVLVMNKEQLIIFANAVALTYLGRNGADVVGNNIYSVVDLAFSEEETFDKWLDVCQAGKVTAGRSWERVRFMLPDGRTKRQFDMAAYYNKNNPSGAETIITFFDKSVSYSKQDDSLSFIALAVHELRTPLTILRGYIEVLEDELQGKISPDLDGFMKRMQVSAQQLSTFVSNILNVARVEENQLFLDLHEEKWEGVLKGIIDDMALRARVHGKKLEYNIQAGLPSVGVDKVSIYEVVSNLIDNAIKYSDRSDRIIIRSYLRNDGLVETTVQDFGLGIPSSIIGNLFEKFYRNHRSRASVGGTGLGLYLSKSIIKAHGGEIWVKSKEGEGSVFGFSLQPYAQLADTLKSADNKDIQRTAHGWIKNHSFYRR